RHVAREHHEVGLGERHRAAARAREPTQLVVSAEEHRGERAAVEVLGGRIRLVERAGVIDLEESLAILLRAPELAHLERDHRPRHDRQADQAEENELHDEARLEYQVENTEAHETSPIAVPTTNLM